MHLKFLRHGQGRVSKAVDYVLGARDHKGEIRPGVRILGGDPGLMVLHGDSIERAWRYSSSMIAWHAQDQPTEDQVQGVLEDFVALAGAELADPVTGMTWLAVEHRSVDSVHVHVLVVREDAATGRAFNPAPPPWRKDFDHLRVAWNAQCGWADPADPDRKRVVAGPRPGRVDERARISQALLERAEAGQFGDRAALIAAAAEYGTVTRAGDDYLSIRPVGATKAIRLKGTLFASADPSAWAVESRPQPARPEPDLQRAAAARARFDAAVTRRHRFGCPEDEERATDDRQRHPGPAVRADRGPDQPGPTADQPGAADRDTGWRPADGPDSAAPVGRTLVEAARALDDLERAVGRADTAGRGLDQGRARLGRALVRFAGAARRTWIRLTGRWTGYPPDQPAQRWATPPTTPVRLPTAGRHDPLQAKAGWNGPTHGGGHSR